MSLREARERCNGDFALSHDKMLIEDAEGWAWGGCWSKFSSALPQLGPVRWWRDDADRYRSRLDPPMSHVRFDISKVPSEERNLEWERMALQQHMMLPIVPMEFDRLEPVDPIADIKISFRWPVPMPKMWIFDVE